MHSDDAINLDDLAVYCIAFLGALWISGLAGMLFSGAATRPVFFALLIAFTLLEPMVAAMRRRDHPVGRGAITFSAWACLLLAPTALLLTLGEASLPDPALAPLFCLPLLFVRTAMRLLDPESQPEGSARR